MKFTIERLALVKMLKLAHRKAPCARGRDKFVRLSACAAMVFIEANQTAAGIESLVVEEGACSLPHELFLKLLQSYAPKTHLTIDVNEKTLRMGTTTLTIADFSPQATAPWSYKIFRPAAMCQQPPAPAPSSG